MGDSAIDLINGTSRGANVLEEKNVRDIAHTIQAHPTLSEAVLEVAMGQLAGSIHFHRI